MLKKFSIALFAFLFALTVTLPGIAAAETSYVGTVIKSATSDTLYYVAADGKRYVFPNEKIYKSWFSGFDDVQTLTDEMLAAIPLGGSIHYRPGIIMIKVDTDPKVYAVSNGGILRWIKSEGRAKKLFGENWNKLIDDLPAGFFANYKIGEPIEHDDDYDADDEVNKSRTIEDNRGLAWGLRYRLSDSVRCRVLEHVADKLEDRKPGKQRPFERIIERLCKQDDNRDKTAPIISGIESTSSTTASTTNALITWTTNEPSNSRVRYATSTVATASSTESVFDANLVTNHSLMLPGLNASTTYYFFVKSVDASGNIATSSQQMFTTQ